jgi:multisubunit Na+/H+ antiporter MnhE subunit
VADSSGPVAGDRGPSRRGNAVVFPRRIGAFLLWWLVLMVLWVWVDDSTDTPELLVGAAVAGMGALFAELVQYQAASPLRIRIEWLAPLSTVPVQLLRDLWVVFGALWRRIVRGEFPKSAFEEVPVDAERGAGARASTHRSVLVAIASITPNTFALGIDPDRETMIVHRLVAGSERP